VASCVHVGNCHTLRVAAWLCCDSGRAVGATRMRCLHAHFVHAVHGVPQPRFVRHNAQLVPPGPSHPTRCFLVERVQASHERVCAPLGGGGGGYRGGISMARVPISQQIPTAPTRPHTHSHTPHHTRSRTPQHTLPSTSNKQTLPCTLCCAGHLHTQRCDCGAGRHHARDRLHHEAEQSELFHSGSGRVWHDGMCQHSAGAASAGIRGPPRMPQLV
jgi:hypothetical protein